MAAALIINCASFLESTPYKSDDMSISVPDAISFDNIGNSQHYSNAIEWFIDAVSDVNYSGADKMTIYGLTYSDLKTMVIESITQYHSVANNSTISNHPYWNNVSSSCFVVHRQCAEALLHLDWNSI
jgi:hypothetical protein